MTRRFHCLFGALLSLCSLLCVPAWSQVTVDASAPADQRPAVLRTANGLPQVEVRTPSATGVSRHRFSQFDVPASGVILNNSRVDTPTRLGGWVRGNPWLAGGSARLILNEVNAREPSQLRGYLEVAGPRTEVVVANPAGIVVDGGGFINASRATLTTGVPIIGGSGSLEGFSVRQGLVDIRGAGLDASTTDATTILSRAMVLQGGLWANDLRVALGPQDTDPAVTRPGSAIAGTGPAPSLALDVGALGGMYAGQIFLLASEAGVGVRNAGGLHALSGSLRIDAAGALLNTDTGTLSARQDVQLAGELRNGGAIDAGGRLQASAREEILNTGSMVGAEVDLAAGQHLANVGPRALIGATDEAGTLILRATVIENLDDQTATDTAPVTTILGLGHVVLTGAPKSKGPPAPAASIVNRSGLIESGRSMTLRASSLTNRRRELVVSSEFDRVPDADELARAGIRLTGRVGQVNTPDPAQIGGVYLDPPHGGFMNSDYLYTDYAGVATMNRVTAISPRGRIVAGGDLDLSRVIRVRNEASDISSGGSIDLGAARLSQEGAPQLLIRVAYSGNYWYRTYWGLPWSQPFADDVRDYPQLRGFAPSLTAHAAIHGSGGALVNGRTPGGAPAADSVSAPPLPAGVAVSAAPPWAPPVPAVVAPPVPAPAPAPAPTPLVTSLPVSVPASAGLPVPVAAPPTSSPAPAPSPVPVPLPASPLFQAASDPQAGVLMQTDPRFTRSRQWTSSVHLLQALGLDPSAVPRRLGDGLYEQRLLREQLVALTGSRLLARFADEDGQYRALMDSAVTQARAIGLVPGVALSAEQVARLTSDIVWLVPQEVDLPEGGRARVLVPQVYLAAASARLRPEGPLVAAASIDLQGQQEIRNGGTLRATGDLRLESRQNLDSRLGKLLAGGTLDLSAQGDIDLAGALVRAGRLQAGAGRDLVVAGITGAQTSQAAGITRQVTTVVRQADVEVTGDAHVSTGRDLLVRGSRVDIGGGLAADVGRDLVVDAVQTSEEKSGQRLGGEASSQFIQHQGSELRVRGDTDLRVGGDMQVLGSEVQLGDHAGSIATVDVQGAVTLGATRDRAQIDSRYQGGGAAGRLHRLDETLQGASLSSDGSLLLQARRDITVTGSRVEVAGTAQLESGGDIRVLAAEERHEMRFSDRGTHTAGLGTRSTRTEEAKDQTFQRGGAIGAGDLGLLAQGSLEVRGSQVLADRDLTLAAEGDVRIEAAARVERSTRFREEARSGLFGSGNGVTLGRRTLSEGEAVQSRQAQAATVGSVTGSVRVRARGVYRQSGGDVLAPGGDVDIRARQVDIAEARETVSEQAEQHTRQAGISAGVSSPLVAGLQSAQRSLEASGRTPDARMKALARTSAALQLYGAYASASGPDAALPEAGRVLESFSLDLTLGSQRAEARQSRQVDQARASAVQAGGRLSIAATGAGPESRLRAQGAQLGAGGDLLLQAEGDVTLVAARNQASERSESSARSASVGLSVSAGGGVSATAAASRSRGQGAGEDLAWSSTVVRAGRRLQLDAGADATLEGAALHGERVDARVGGRLRIESLQDSARYDSQTRSAGVSVSVPLSGPGAGVPGGPGGGNAAGGAGASGWRVGRNQTQAQGHTTRVSTQAGVFAGAEGFGVEVRGDTTLVGGALVGGAYGGGPSDPGPNHLTTASLDARDLRNASSARASSQGGSLSSDMASQGRYGAGKAVVGKLMDQGSGSQSSEGMTRSVLSPATVRITDEALQRTRTGQSSAEVVASLRREPEGANERTSRLDARVLLEQAQAEQTIRNEAVRTFTQFSDPAWRVMFKETPQFYRVTCPSGADCTRNPELARRERMTGTPEQVRAEISQAPAGAVLAVNGIQNDAQRAAVLAMQNAKPGDDGAKPGTVFMLHYLPTGNAISELMVAGYEKSLSDFLGATHPTLAYAQVLQARGDRETTSLGHSRGTLVQTNALGILARNGARNRDLAVQGLGGPVSATKYIQAAARVVDPAKADRIEFSYFANDPVAVVAGGNPGVVSLSELWRVFTTSNSAHSCYGTGAAGCRQVQYPVPNAPPGAVQDASTLVRVTPSTLSSLRKP